MKDGTTHLAYKAEHAVDLQTEAIVAATVTPADRGDGASGAETLIVAQWNLHQSGSAAAVTQLVADKGYHDNGCWRSARTGRCAPTSPNANKRAGSGRTSRGI